MNTEMELKKIERENEEFLHMLPGRDIDDVLDVYEYVATYNIGRQELELVKKDLIQIGLDANERGETFLQAIGDKAAFVKAMVENYKKKPLIVRVAKFFCILTALYSVCFLLGCLGTENGYVSISLRDFILWGGLFLSDTIFAYKGRLYLRVMKGNRNKQLNPKVLGIDIVIIAVALGLGRRGRQELFALPILPTFLLIVVILAVTGGILWHDRKK